MKLFSLDIIAIKVNALEKRILHKDFSSDSEKIEIEEEIKRKQEEYWTTLARYNSAI